MNDMIDKIHKYWFGVIENETTIESRNQLWFGGDDSTDAYILENFEMLVLQAKKGTLDSWQQSSKGTLALILLLDQFPLNIYRKSAKAFSFEEKSLSVCNLGINKGQDLELTFIERTFFYLPFEHSESQADQARSVELFSKLKENAPEPLKDHAQSSLDYAISHKKIVDQFRRFPHRNEVLGRTSSQTEICFLDSGNYRFGQ